MPGKTALVINPWVTDFKLYDEWMHPLGLYFLISLLKHNGWDVQYFNCLERKADDKAKRYSTGDFASSIIDKPEIYRKIPRRYKRYGRPDHELDRFISMIDKPNAVFITSGMTYWIDGLKHTVEIIHKNLPEAPIIIGGLSARLIPEVLRKEFPLADIYDASLISSTRRPSSIFDLSMDSWTPSLIDGFKSTSNLLHGPVLTSIGCPMSCSFCASHYLNAAYQSRQILQIADEIEYLANAQVMDFAFFDDALLYQPDAVFIPLMKEIGKRNIHGRFHLPNGIHLRWITNEILETMAASGFVTLRFGYESGAAEYRDDISGKISRELVSDKIRMMQSHGFLGKNIGLYVMGGLPGQSVEQVIDDMHFISSLGVMVKPVYVSPVPHTALFDRYATVYPQITTNPLAHNDLYFITQLPGWDFNQTERIRILARELNGKIAL